MLLFSLCVHALDPACLAKCHTLIIIMNRNVTKHDVDYSTNNKCWLGGRNNSLQQGSRSGAITP